MKKTFLLTCVLLAVVITTNESCFRKKGCTDPDAVNYNSSANYNDGSCIAKVYGCTDHNASNYNSAANTSDGSCSYTTQITVWTALSTFPCGTAAIDVYVDGTWIGTITQYYPSTPSCGASGGVSTNVSYGQHTLSAQCSSGTSTWGPISVNVSGSCYKWQLN